MDRSLYGVFSATSKIYSDIVNGSKAYNRSDVELAEALTTFFSPFSCEDVVITENIDKPFFGMYVKPIYSSSMSFVERIFKDYQSTKYYFEPFAPWKFSIEIDGKLIRNAGLTVREIVAMMITEIMAINSTETATHLRNAIDLCLSDYHMEGVDMDKIKKTNKFFYLVGNITIHNMHSIFNTSRNVAILYPNDGYPSILSELGNGLVEAYKTGLEKIDLFAGRMEDYDTSTVLLSWYLNNYQSIYHSRYYQEMFRDAMTTEASTLIKNMILNALRDECTIGPGWGVTDDDDRFLYDVMTESAKKGLVYQMKRNGIKSIEEDLYEYTMRLRNVETQDDAILLMRQINSRMGILEDYIRDEDISEEDKARWEKCYQGYLNLREELSKKTVYNRKMYGLFVDYNALQNMDNAGTFMNTYY